MNEQPILRMSRALFRLVRPRLPFPPVPVDTHDLLSSVYPSAQTHTLSLHIACVTDEQSFSDVQLSPSPSRKNAKVFIKISELWSQNWSEHNTTFLNLQDLSYPKYLLPLRRSLYHTRWEVIITCLMSLV